ncbi:MAG TPA: A/G-specific adenine glycosylase [Alphaproteobacteria bacterium]|nr:A/G-specific adenine glycosylase [Alphaproteobacteria bacterium]
MRRSTTSAPAVTFSRREARELAARLLAWYDRHRRSLPWRSPPGLRADPYRVWLSEIMLQQTTVKAVEPYFHGFLARWPDVDALARADQDEVLHAWQGLGYYARARNLHRCAREVRDRHGSRFPDNAAALAKLPGIGPYTAAAIAAIAFDEPATVVDGNVERVMARLFGVATPLPGAKPRLRTLAAALTPAERPGDYAQAVMDLGAVICTPRRPRCVLCPWQPRCAARAQGLAEELPRRAAKPVRPLRRGVAFWLVRDGAEVLLQRRPEEGLLGGLMELPSTAWRADAWTLEEAKVHAPLSAQWRALPGVVRHGFTHFELELSVVAGHVRETAEEPQGVNEGQGPHWCRLDRLSDYALPTVMKKVIAHALAHEN